jgi:predicted methyltransferase
MFFKDQGWDFPADVVMPQVLASLKVGGKLLVVDHSAASKRGAQDTKTLHRIEAKFVINDLKKYGFTLVKQATFLENKNDTRNTSVFSPELRRKTDRFVLLFERIK